MSGLSAAPFDPATACLGHGQTWQDVTVSRAGGTSYQNTTGRPIAVNIMSSGGGNYFYQVSPDNVTWQNMGHATGNGVVRNASFEVPDGWFYRISNAAMIVQSWQELT